MSCLPKATFIRPDNLKKSLHRLEDLHLDQFGYRQIVSLGDSFRATGQPKKALRMHMSAAYMMGFAPTPEPLSFIAVGREISPFVAYDIARGFPSFLVEAVGVYGRELPSLSTLEILVLGSLGQDW